MATAGSDRSLRILIIDAHIPDPELGVGYPRAQALLQALVTRGHAVALAPRAGSAEALAAARRVVPAGVELHGQATTADLGTFLQAQAGRFDLLLVSRPDTLRAVLAAWPDTRRAVPLLYDAEALHALRTVRQHAAMGRPLSAAEAAALLDDEVGLARRADHVLAVQDAECEVFRSRGCPSVSMLGHGFAPAPTPRAWVDRRDLLFVGALDDDPSPNVDALTTFVQAVLPLIRLPDGTRPRLLVAGRCAAPAVRALASSQVVLLGPVPDLGDLYDHARVFVAPHRYAAGLPTKVLEAASRGLPCVCTGLLAGQLGWSNDGEVLAADVPQAMADAVLRLWTDESLWTATRGRALRGLAQRFSPDRFDAELDQALAAALRAGLPRRAASSVTRAAHAGPGTPAAPAGETGPRSVAARAMQAARRFVRRMPGTLLHRVDARRIARAAAFDREWYLRVNADVAAAGADPALHYLLYGAAEGRDPGPGFSTMGYLSRYPEVARSGRNPLLHFERVGAARGYSAAPRSHGVPASSPMRVVILGGEPGTRGLDLRVTQLAQALRDHGATAVALTVEQALQQPEDLACASVLVLWRTVWDERVARMVRLARQGGACIVFDADDLVIEPALARVDVIDGIRTQGLTEEEVRLHFVRMLQAFEAADWALASTEVLAAHMRVRGKLTFVLPNGFDDDGHRRSRLALRRRQAVGDRLHVRIGYAAGTRTHQRDFAVAADALADVLRQRPRCRLVLFRGQDGRPLVDLDEFPAFHDLRDRIEWRAFVTADRLCDELARFDLNIAPVETGNAFCESKSELKFVDAALVGVCTVASPTDPFVRAIETGRNGFLADSPDAWRTVLLQLVDDPAWRHRAAAAAYRQVLWDHGPRCRAERVASMLDQMLAPAREAARASAWQMARADRSGRPTASAMALPEAHTILATDRLRNAQVTVIVPLRDYAPFIVEALDSVAAQTLVELDLVVVDDASTDESLAVARTWMQRNGARFNRALLLRHQANAGLGPTRNTAFEHAETPFVLPLDADDRLLPGAGERLLAALHDTRADFAYPLIQQFGDGQAILGAAPYAAQRLVGGNCISAIALLRKDAWSAVGGYADMPQGWEDYDLWCALAERGLFGVQVPEVLAGVRVHRASMTHRVTEPAIAGQGLLADMQRRHPWLSLTRAFGVPVPAADADQPASLRRR